MIDLRRRWAPLVIAASYSVALLVPALMPSVQAKDAPLRAGAIAAMTADPAAADMLGGPDPAVMAVLHAQARAALRDLQMASAPPQ
jgi:hypothetical protein